MPSLYGTQTELALKNFPVIDHASVQPELIRAMIQIKKAAAVSHATCNELSLDITNAIITSCDELLSSDHPDYFVTASIQGGAGTSINMNVNEVIATLASSKTNTAIHPNDHVNKSQSTNDVNPSALRIACITLSSRLTQQLEALIDALGRQAKAHKSLQKLARTHLQDALPMQVSDELLAYQAIMQKHLRRITRELPSLDALNLGGTAIGDGTNASPSYREHVYLSLREITCIPSLHPAENLMAQTSSQTDFVCLALLVKALFIDLSKMATDIRLLSSGPRGGLGEIILEARQSGSSIMPGKVNPVIPEYINQVYYAISGKTLTIEHAAEGAVLELGVMFPVLADALLSSLKIATASIETFTLACIDTLHFDAHVCTEHLERSTAYATRLTPLLGYDCVSQCVHTAIQDHTTLREVILSHHLLSEEQFDHAVHAEIETLIKRSE